MHGAVFLDRDGVVNRNVIRDGKLCAPRTLAQFRLLPGVTAASHALMDAGYPIVIVTNQPDIGNNFITPSIVEAMHERLCATLAPAAIEICPHSQGAGCDCRKPKPGMLTRAAARLGIALEKSFMIGDRWSDVAAGHAVGCRTFLVRRGPIGDLPVMPDAIVGSMPAAARLILSGGPGRAERLQGRGAGLHFD
jgi:D-glycero-D-manno-heptose 1,7-bisphosphate phosphatase